MFLQRMRDGVSFLPFISFKIWTLHECVCHPCTVAMLIFVLFQFYCMCCQSKHLFHHLADAKKNYHCLPGLCSTTDDKLKFSGRKKSQNKHEFFLCTSVPSWTIAFKDPYQKKTKPARAREIPISKNKV